MKPMDPQKNFATIDALFHKVINKMKRVEQKPRYFGTDVLLYPSEIHTIESIGHHPGINITELAALQGVTKGAVSQIVKKLVAKKMVIRMKEEGSEREVLLKLSDSGTTAFQSHDDFHARIAPDMIRLIEEADAREIRFVTELFCSIDRFCDEVLREP